MAKDCRIFEPPARHAETDGSAESSLRRKLTGGLPAELEGSLTKGFDPMATLQTGLDQPLWDASLFLFRSRAVGFQSADEPRQPISAPRPIRGLLLDACNVLYDDTAWRRWLLRLLLRLGLRTEYGPFFRIFDRDYLDAVYRGQQPFGDALDAFLVSAGLSAGQAEEVHRALDSHRRHRDLSHRLLIGVRQTVTQLHLSGVTLGVLCNCEHSGETLRKQLAELMGESPWAAVVSSRDLGCTMPAATCYEAALQAMQLPAAEVAFVGHDARELRGAAVQGMATIAFNSDRDARADVYLQRFDDLIELTRFSPGCLAAA
jgi:FMN phosphatase YigB (HAD superfamily)